MSSTAADEDLATRLRRMNAESDQFVAEQRKLMAESEKLNAEQRKLVAKADKFPRERTLAVMTSGAALLAAGAAIGGVAVKLLGG